MTEISAQVTVPGQSKPLFVAADGTAYMNGRPFMLPFRPTDDTMNQLNDLIVLLATACSSAVVVKKAIDEIWKRDKQ